MKKNTFSFIDPNNNICRFVCLSKIRIFFYTIMSALQDEETQIKGMVAVSYTVGQTEFVKGRAQQFAKSSIELPVRFVSIHGCAEPSILNHVVMNFMQTLMKEWNLCRIRIHIGTSYWSQEHYHCCSVPICVYAVPFCVSYEQLLLCGLRLSRRNSYRMYLQSFNIRNSERSITD